MDTAISHPGVGRALDQLTEQARAVPGIRTGSVEAGDWVVVKTRNSTYSLAAGGDGTFQVAGGWFSSHDAEATKVKVLGCTWGGRALHTGLVAAPGMFVEFSNGVRTTRIREVRLIRGGDANRH